MDQPAVIVGEVDGEGPTLGNGEASGFAGEPGLKFFEGSVGGRGRIDAGDNSGAGEALKID